MIRFWPIFVLLIIPFVGIGQEIVIKGTILDSDSQLPVANVNIGIDDEDIDFKTKSNFSGEFQLPFDIRSGSSIFFQKSGYADLKITPKIKNKQVHDGVFILQVTLAKGEMLTTVNITPHSMPVKVYGSQQHSVSDFEFMDNGFLLLTYDKNPKKQRKILWTDKKMTIIKSLSIPESAGVINGFEKSYANDILLNTTEKLYEVQTKNNLELIEVDRKMFDDYVKPIVDTLHNKVYLSNWYDKFPAFGYFEYSIVDSTYSLIREIADDFMLELCRAEYKYLSGQSKLMYYRQEMVLGIDKEILACIDQFDHGTYYDPLYAPMFIVNDTVLVFDHCDNLLCRYDLERHAIDSLPIDYHEPGKKINKTFTETLLRDESNDRIYAQFQHQGGDAVLKEINLKTGEILSEHVLKYPYPSEVKVLNGFAYYIYRPFESTQKKYLYKEPL